MNISVGGVIEIQTAITKDCQLAVSLKFTVHGVQSFIKGHRKSGVISIKHSRVSYNLCINPWSPPLMQFIAMHI